MLQFIWKWGNNYLKPVEPSANPTKDWGFNWTLKKNDSSESSPTMTRQDNSTIEREDSTLSRETGSKDKRSENWWRRIWGHEESKKKGTWR